MRQSHRPKSTQIERSGSAQHRGIDRSTSLLGSITSRYCLEAKQRLHAARQHGKSEKKTETEKLPRHVAVLLEILHIPPGPISIFERAATFSETFSKRVKTGYDLLVEFC